MPQSRFAEFQSHPGTKFLTISLLTLACLIPLSMIDLISTERALRQADVTRELAEAWGGPQTITGPFLVVPYIEVEPLRSSNGFFTDENDENGKRTLKRFILTPKSLEADTVSNVERRHRGIYETPVFQADMTVTGTFDIRRGELKETYGSEILWGQAELMLGIEELRSARDIDISWNGIELDYEPRNRLQPDRNRAGTSTSVVLKPIEEPQPRFEINLVLNGSERISLVPLGQENSFSASGNWTNPSFGGAFLPGRHTIDQQGFEAHWQIPYYATGISRDFTEEAWNANSFDQTLISVSFYEPADIYQMVERSIKYGILFVALTFLTFFVIETVAMVSLHFMQYIFIGLALSMFFLTLLSLSELMDFAIAYALSSTVIVSMIGLYSLSILRKKSHAAIVCAVLICLYVSIFGLLSAEAFALANGTFLLLVALSATMYVTRNVAWGNTRGGPEGQVTSTEAMGL